jgi:hypothetical protein
MRGAAALAALLLLASGAPLGAQPEAQECRLALVLALDVSSSVDVEEDRLQREGLAAALVAPEVVRAALGGEPVALHVFEWSGIRTQVPLLPGWRVIEGEEDLRAVAVAVAGSRRSTVALPTALGNALGFAADLLRDGPPCRRRTVDVAGDGVANEGVDPATAYRIFPFEGVTVNALVLGDARSAESREVTRRTVAWFQAEVLRGPGAFSVVADGYADYERAMRLKLVREMELPAVSGGARAQAG